MLPTLMEVRQHLLMLLRPFCSPAFSLCSAECGSHRLISWFCHESSGLGTRVLGGCQVPSWADMQGDKQGQRGHQWASCVNAGDNKDQKTGKDMAAQGGHRGPEMKLNSPPQLVPDFFHASPPHHVVCLHFTTNLLTEHYSRLIAGLDSSIWAPWPSLNQRQTPPPLHLFQAKSAVLEV
jgi:hypothetical protein